MTKFTLISQEYICKKCKGTGLFDYKNANKNNLSYFIAYNCFMCQGKGKIDWITNITGSIDYPITITKRYMTREKYNEIISR